MVNTNENTEFFKLTFYSTNGSLKYKVFSEGLYPMKMFVQQHNFGRDILELIEPVPEGTDLPDGEILRPYKFKSKYSDTDVYTIYTTDDFVSDAVQAVCAELAEYLVFGDVLIRTNIELMKTISDLIGELKYVYVLDHGSIDGDTGELYSQDFEKYVKVFDPFMVPAEDGFDDAYIYDSMTHAMLSQEIQPITLEAYVSSFASIVTDEQ